MTDMMTTLSALRRPRLLIRAARFGLTDYNRDRVLRRLTKSAATPTPSKALGWLIEEEARVEDNRLCDTAIYSPARHIELLVAIIAEARLLPQGKSVTGGA